MISDIFSVDAARGRNSAKQKKIKVKAKKRGDKPGFSVVGGADYGTGIYINKYECIRVCLF